MKFTLTKLSEPGWERDFYSKVEVQSELYQHICNQCRSEEGITPLSGLADMLCTPCGCEFMLEEEA